MPYIYTISHPFTNEVVYVGCTKNLKNRMYSHGNCKNDSAVGEWIKSLADQYILPKVEPIEICEMEDMLYLEGYWINQMQQWGFKLLNINKADYFKKTKLKISRSGKAYRVSGKQALRVRYSKKWDISDLDFGKTFTIPKTQKDRRILTATFKNYCRKFFLIRYLKYEEVGDTYIATVTAEKQIKPKPFGVTKKGYKRYLPLSVKPRVERRAKGEKFKWGFDVAKIGDTFNLPFTRFETFKVCFGAYKRKHGLPLAYKFKFSEDNSYFIFEYVSENEVFKNPIVPGLLTRNKATSGKKGNTRVLTDTQRIEVLNSKLSVRELALVYDVSESTIYKIVNK